jgi:lipopolysaccharide export system permease protein
MPKTDESYFKNLRNVMNVWQVSEQVDSCQKTIGKIGKQNVEQLSAANLLLKNDTAKVKIKLPTIVPDTNKNRLAFIWQVPDSLRKASIVSAEISARNIKSMIEINAQNAKLQNLNLVDSQIELHKRFTLPMACILLFVIGAALGSIIRKGGLGLPFIAAVIFFVIYYFMNSIGENIAKELVVSVPIGMWYPSVVLALIGAYMMYEANTDSKRLKLENYKNLFKLGKVVEPFLYIARLFQSK